MKKVGLLCVSLALVLLLNAPVWCGPAIPNMAGIWNGSGQGINLTGGPETRTFDVSVGQPTVDGKPGQFLHGDFEWWLPNSFNTDSLGYTGQVSSTGQVTIIGASGSPDGGRFLFSGTLSNRGATLTGVLQVFAKSGSIYPGVPLEPGDTFAITLNKAP